MTAPLLVRLARVALALVLGGLAGLAYAPVFGGTSAPFLAAVLGAVGAAGGAGALAALLPRLPAAAVALGGLVAVVGVAAAVTGVGTSLAKGPWHLLTGALPADPAGPPLAAAAALAGWVTLAAVLLAAYGGGAFAPLVPPLLGLLAALSLGAAVGPPPAWYGPAVVAAAAGLLFTANRQAYGPRGDGARRVRAAATGAAVVALAVLAASLVGPALPGAGARPPADVRALVAAPVQPRSGVSPLQQYLALRNGKRPLKLTGTVSRPGTPLRLATLTRFDGTYWTVAGDFRLAGTRLPGAAATGDDAALTGQVTVAAGELDWLVTAGRATRVDVAGLGVNEATGDLAVPVGATPPTAYTMTSTVPTTDVDRLLADDPVAPDARPDPPLPPAVRAFVDAAVRDEPDGPDQLLALYRALRTSGRFSDDQAAEAPGGHGYFQIQRLLTGRRGTAEQYASAFAVMARHLGYDARVVMGFRPRYTGEAFVATGRDVTAWVEVRLAASGWVPIDPTPRDHPIGTRPGAPPVGSAASAADDPLGQADAPRGTEPDGADTTPGDLAAAPAPGGPAWSIAAAVAALLLALLAAGPVTRAVRRWRRRRAPSTRRAILGAWWETTDGLRAAGLPVTAAMTTGDVVTAVGARVSAPDLAELARLVDSAAYAPGEPPRERGVQAWSHAARVRRQVHATTSVARRAGAFLRPAPLPARRRVRTGRSTGP